jgi:hypothetical protein
MLIFILIQNVQNDGRYERSAPEIKIINNKPLWQEDVSSSSAMLV